MKIIIYALVLIVVAAVALTIGAFITQALWGWVIPDIFSGMVSADLLPARITLFQAVKLELLLAIWFGGSSVSSSKK